MNDKVKFETGLFGISKDGHYAQQLGTIEGMLRGCHIQRNIDISL
jgi:hypothetical protein